MIAPVLRSSTRYALGLVVVVGATVASLAPAVAQQREYPTRYYIIHTDLDETTVREAALRITTMAEEYVRRSQSFSGKITQRLPFHLFGSLDDYHAVGGIPGSMGLYNGRSLMAVAVPGRREQLWRILQHEGYHQFVHAVITGDIPVWVNEGMAVYFEEAVFTGDGVVTGLIPQRRLERIRAGIEEGGLKSVAQMMLLERTAWNHELRSSNYDQAWSMVHFLAHADEGRLQPRFEGFLRDVGNKRLDWKGAWVRNFGNNTADFQKAWKAFWLAMPDDPTADLYAETTVATITSFLARAFVQKQSFRNFTDFKETAAAGRLKLPPNDWLPPSLLTGALLEAKRTGEWKLLKHGRRPPQISCTLDNGLTLTGSFKMHRKRFGKITVARSNR